MATPGQQFADWNSVPSSDGGGILGALGAMALDKSGAADWLNSKLPEGMSMMGGKIAYKAPTPYTGVTAPAANPMQQDPMSSAQPPTNSTAAVPPTSVSWDDPSNGSSKLDMLAKMFMG
jgi:uncharacterized membrane protein YebE (DUF533 family)